MSARSTTTKPNAPATAIRLAPFPKLTWDGSFWTGQCTLRSWAGFQARAGGYGARSRRRPSVGRVRLTVASPDGAGAPPAAEQIAAFGYLLANEDAVTAAVLGRVFKEYPRLRREHNEYVEEEYPDDEDDGWIDPDAPRKLPAVKDRTGLREVVGLAIIHVLYVAKRGVAYTGFELGCEWDDEHGAGVMVHRGRVVRFGHADSSFVAWMAREDGGTSLEPVVSAPASAQPTIGRAARSSTPSPKR